MNKTLSIGWRNIGLIAVMMLAVIFAGLSVSGEPSGASFTQNATYNYSVDSPTWMETSGGSFTVLQLNVTTQNPRWKAYVGNVSGTLTLRESSGNAIYDWTVGTVSGEVYAVRADDPDWTSISCAPVSDILTEGTDLSLDNTKVDSVNSTFNTTAHASFYVGAENVSDNQCRAISTFVNNQRQTGGDADLFQEILLSDGSNIIYTTLLEDAQYGFNGQEYDFQMILPNNEYAATPTKYYFYAELG